MVGRLRIEEIFAIIISRWEQRSYWGGEVICFGRFGIEIGVWKLAHRTCIFGQLAHAFGKGREGGGMCYRLLLRMLMQRGMAFGGWIHLQGIATTEFLGAESLRAMKECKVFSQTEICEGGNDWVTWWISRLLSWDINVMTDSVVGGCDMPQEIVNTDQNRAVPPSINVYHSLCKQIYCFEKLMAFWKGCSSEHKSVVIPFPIRYSVRLVACRTAEWPGLSTRLAVFLQFEPSQCPDSCSIQYQTIFFPHFCHKTWLFFNVTNFTCVIFHFHCYNFFYKFYLCFVLFIWCYRGVYHLV